MPVNPDLLARYKRQIGLYRDRTAGFLVATWDRLGMYGDEQVIEFEKRTGSVLIGAKTASVALSAGFFALAIASRPVSVSAGEVEVEPRIRDPFLAMWHAVGVGRPNAEAIMAGRSMAEAVGFNFVQSTARRTGDLVAERSGKTVRWRRVPGAKSCPWCRLVAGQTYHSAESADFGHDRCVLGDTLVSAPSAREAVRRRYSGEVVVLRTASGNELSVTPNHPILTDRGWLGAGLLSEGMNVVRSGPADRPVPSVVPHEHNMPSRIEESFRAGAVRSLVSVPFAAENFHGDWGDGEVDVVPALRLLNDHILTEVSEPAFEFDFSGGPFEHPGRLSRTCRSHKALFGLGLSPGGSIRSGSLGLTFLGSRQARPESTGFAPATWLDPLPEQVLPQRVAVDADALGEGQFRLAGQVTLDRITELRRVRRSSQWVYNLRTDDGWYAANGIVVHNCDCDAVPAV